MALADSGRTLDQQRALLADPLTGRQRLDATAFHRGLEAEVEVGDRLARGQSAEDQGGADATLLAVPEFLLEQSIEEAVGRGVALDRFGDSPGW